jgi:hypothetical protein
LTLHSLQRKLSGFDIHQEVQEALIETSGAMITLNQGQMFIGRRADGTEITPTYSDLTIELKEQKGQPSDRVTLRDTSEFWDDMFVQINASDYEMSSANQKTQKLEKKYGRKIFGLTKESRSEEFIPLYFLPELQSRITKKLGFKFG